MKGLLKISGTIRITGEDRTYAGWDRLGNEDDKVRWDESGNKSIKGAGELQDREPDNQSLFENFWQLREFWMLDG